MNIPTIFDWLERLEPLRGYPAVIIILITAALIALFLDWRLALFAMIVQYLAASLLFVDLLDPRLAIIKLFVGMFVCLILYMTARQVDYGRFPDDLTAAEAARLSQDSKQYKIWRLTLSRDLAIRAIATTLTLLLLFLITQIASFRLPGVPEDLPYINTAVLILMSLGLVGLAASRDPLPAGMGLFTFLTGFELYYAALDQSIAMLAALAALNLAIALAVAYLAQARRASLYILNETKSKTSSNE
jgi:hypothetical protein